MVAVKITEVIYHRGDTNLSKLTPMENNVTEEIIEKMKEKLIADGFSGRFLGDAKNPVQYMEAEEVIETFNKCYPNYK